VRLMPGASLVPGHVADTQADYRARAKKRRSAHRFGRQAAYGLRFVLSDWTHTRAYGKVVQVFALLPMVDVKAGVVVPR
jgi:hypothetical protein